MNSFPSSHPDSTTVQGVLKGYDQLLNLVMDDLQEVLKGAFAFSLFSESCAHCRNCTVDPETGAPLVPAQTRNLGLAVLRGTSLVVISPVDGCVLSLPLTPSRTDTNRLSSSSEEIANPFQTD